MFAVTNTTTIPRWYLFLDGLTLGVSIIGTIISTAFLLTIIISRQERRSISNLIASNTQLSICLLSGVNIYSIIRVFNGDLYGIHTFSIQCIWEGYFVYAETGNIVHSFAIQSYYRYVRVIYASRPHYSSMKTLCTIIIIQWLIIHGVMLVLPLGNYIEFDVDSQMCSVSLFQYRVVWLLFTLVYMPAYNVIAFVYIHLAILIRQSRKRASGVILNNARRELQLIKRMLIVFFTFAVSSLPYSIFAILALFNKNLLPVYYYRILTCFNAIALAIATNIILWHSLTVRRIIVMFIMRKNNQRIHPNPAVLF